MQPLSCDLWLMDLKQLQRFVAAWKLGINQESARAIASVTPKKENKVGKIPVFGPIEARPTFLGEVLGMPSYERIGNAVDMMMADSSVTSIMLDIFSPGGMVYGAQELAQKIYSYRGKGKPIIAVANPMAASGAYWIGAAADRLVMMPSGEVGSVGVITEHVDLTQALEREGAKVTIIRSSGSPFKAEQGDSEPLTEEAKAYIQDRADAIYERFVADLARFRGVSVDHVKEHFGKGRVVDARKAKAVGMVDYVDTLQGVFDKVHTGRYRMGKEAAMDVWDGPTRRESLLAKSAALIEVANSQPVEVV